MRACHATQDRHPEHWENAANDHFRGVGGANDGDDWLHEEVTIASSKRRVSPVIRRDSEQLAQTANVQEEEDILRSRAAGNGGNRVDNLPRLAPLLSVETRPTRQPAMCGHETPQKSKEKKNCSGTRTILGHTPSFLRHKCWRDERAR